MPSISPFGSNSASGTYNIGQQQFCGALVQSFQASADFASQAGNASVVLIDDQANGYRFVAPVISAPTGIVIRDLSGNTIFEFYGIVDSISRNSTVSDKKYSVNLVSPLKILQAATIITDGYTGYGRTYEGVPRYFSHDGYYDISDNPTSYLPTGVSKTPNVDYFQVTQVAFSTNNENLTTTGMWSKQYNNINVFGAFENNSVGIVSFKGFGASAVSEEGMTLDRVCYAIDKLVNQTTSAADQRYLGGNLLFGTNTYNVCSTAAGYTDPFPYYYGFDAIGFYNQVRPYLSANYRIKGPLSILEMVTQVCEEINAEFIVNLERVSYTSGSLTSYNNTTYSVYSSGQFTLSQTYTNSLLGGILWIQVIPKNVYVNCNRPFSDIAYNLLSLEKPNFGGYGIESGVNPGIMSTGFLNPLDSSYTNVGTQGSTPYGGSFPVASTGSSTGSLLSYHLNRATDISISVKAADSTTSKMVVGGYQTRMVSVPRDYIYQYWGNIKIQSSGSSNCSNLTRSSDKIIPVITQILPPNDIVDMIMVDINDIIPREVSVWNSIYWENAWSKPLGGLTGSSLISDLITVFTQKGAGNTTAITPISSGIYFTSVSEIRAAMQSYDEWESYMTSVKKAKYRTLSEFLLQYSNYINNINTHKFNQIKKTTNYLKIDTKDFNIRKRDKSVKYTGLKKAISLQTELEEPEELDEELFMERIVEKLRTIGEDHYGKSWYAPIPFFGTKLTENLDNLIGNYVRSWELTNSAYVEPSLFYTIDAPFDSKFMDNGRLQSFVNFEYYSQSGTLGYDLFTNKITGFTQGNKPVFDFTEYKTEDIVIDNTGCFPNPLVHTHPSDISSDYQFIPCNYFGVYNRYSAPFFEITANAVINPASGVESLYGRVNALYGRSYYYSSPTKTGIMPATAINSCASSATLVNSSFNDSSKLNELNTSGVMNSGYNGFFIQYPTQANSNMAANLLRLNFNDHGLNSFPFVRFETERVFFPHVNNSGLAANDPQFGLRLALLSEGIDDANIDFYMRQDIATQTQSSANTDFDLFKPILPPKSVCIPQVSNRFTYGPWMSNYAILYCGKSEFETNPDLVPENYIVPNYGTVAISGGTFVSGVSSQTSGFAGLNLAGQAIANSIDNFSFFALEEGTITIPGLPLITRIGQNLLSGPRITDIQVSINNNEITTTYNFKQNSPRLGRTNRDVVKLLNKISKTIKR